MRNLEERDRLITENMPLLSWLKGRLQRKFYTVKKALLLTDEDIEELCDIAMVKAATRWSPERGAFATFLYTVAIRDITTTVKRRERDLAFKCLSLDFPIEADRERSDFISLMDLLADPEALLEVEGVVDNLVARNLARDLLRIIEKNPLALEILKKRAAGMTYREIGESVGVSYQRCQQIVKHVRERAEAIRKKYE